MAYTVNETNVGTNTQSQIGGVQSLMQIAPSINCKTRVMPKNGQKNGNALTCIKSS